MKKTINVNGTNFTVDVNITSEDRYNTIDSDYKKLLYLLGQVSSIGAKIDHEFTMRNALIEKRKDIIQDHKKWGSTQKRLEEDLKQNSCFTVGPELKLSKHQKETVIDTINSTMWWYKALKSKIEQL